MAIGIIPARYGSTRFPGKPLAKIGTVTLLQRTYENATKASCFSKLVVATDDKRIFDHAKSFGADVVMTSPHCPTGTDRMVEACLKLGVEDHEVVVNVQGDVPALEIEAIEKVVSLLYDYPDEVMATAAVRIKDEQEAYNPSIVKCALDSRGSALYFSRALIPYRTGGFDPSYPYYHHLGIYAFRFAFAKRYAELPMTPLQRAEDLEQLKVLENGFRIQVAIVESVSFGVDRPEDIEKMEKLICR